VGSQNRPWPDGCR